VVEPGYDDFISGRQPKTISFSEGAFRKSAAARRASSVVSSVRLEVIKAP
jgi:hypothetical protein